jgi:hypothetical protein
MVHNISGFVEILRFRSIASKILLALIIIIICTIFTAGGLYSVAPHGGTAIIGALLGIIVGLIIDVVVFGWLGVFFMFAFFFLLLALGIGYALLKGSGG